MARLLLFLVASFVLALSALAHDAERAERHHHRTITIGPGEQVGILPRRREVFVSALPAATTTTTVTATTTAPGITKATTVTATTTAPGVIKTTTVPGVTTTITVTATTTAPGVTKTTTVPGVTTTITVTATTTAPGVTTTTTVTVTTSGPPASNTSTARSFRNMAYFANTNGNDTYSPQNLPASQLTHVIYAFANLDSNGTVHSSDTNKDLGNPDDRGKNALGAVGQFYNLKKKNRQLKVLLSVGGGGDDKYSPATTFALVAANEKARKQFATTAARLMGDYGFDGIDIDWEYPYKEQAPDFVKLLQALRDELDNYSKQYAPTYRFLLTAAVSATPDYYNNLTESMASLKPLIDIWNVEGYDFSRDPTDLDDPNRNDTLHKANLYPEPLTNGGIATPFSANQGVQFYLANGIAPANISLGLVTYGTSFPNTTLPVGSPFTGNVIADTPYYSLPQPNTQEVFDREAVAAYSYDKNTGVLISYDNVDTVNAKANYVKNLTLGGIFFYQAFGDKTGNLSLVATAANQLLNLDTTRNLLVYPNSTYDNIRSGN